MRRIAIYLMHNVGSRTRLLNLQGSMPCGGIVYMRQFSQGLRQALTKVLESAQGCDAILMPSKRTQKYQERAEPLKPSSLEKERLRGHTQAVNPVKPRQCFPPKFPEVRVRNNSLLFHARRINTDLVIFPVSNQNSENWGTVYTKTLNALQ